MLYQLSYTRGAADLTGTLLQAENRVMVGVGFEPT